jgi:hypothetical protein
MKIKRFNKTNIHQRETGKATLYIHNKGNFCFSEGAAIKMGVSESDTVCFIEIIQDEENPKDWYAALTTEEIGFKLRKEKAHNKYNFNSGLIAKSILNTLPKSPPLVIQHRLQPHF